MKPVIGVIPLYDDEKDSVWMLPGYLDGLKAAGAIPVILPLHMEQSEFEQIKGNFNGYLFTGGHDVSPELYHEPKSTFCGTINADRDQLEQFVFEEVMRSDIPCLAICRGIQLINVLLGGTLYQDIPTEYNGTIQVEHHMCTPYDKTIHEVTISKESPLFKVVHKSTINVNSYHHQGIKQLGEDIEVMAVAEDGLIEGIYVPNKRFIWGIQWHPEFIYQVDVDQFNILSAFVKACVPTLVS